MATIGSFDRITVEPGKCRRKAVHPWDAHYGATRSGNCSLHTRTARLWLQTIRYRNRRTSTRHSGSPQPPLMTKVSVLTASHDGPRVAAEILRQRGFDANYVTEIGLDCSEDSEILATAAAQNRVWVTLDHGFHARLALSAAGPSVILLRIEGLGASAQGDLIESICRNGRLLCVTVQQFPPKVTRCGFRRLPLR